MHGSVNLWLRCLTSGLQASKAQVRELERDLARLRAAVRIDDEAERKP